MKINIKAITVMIKKISLLLGVIISSTAFADKVQLLDPKVSFQAVHRNGAHIWASGTNGGIYKSTDNGQQWNKIEGPKDSENLQFRDIQPLGKGGLIVMSAGEGDNSRIYRTHDSGKNWQLQIAGQRASTFYDCLHFINDQDGWLYGDSDEDGLFILATNDGGISWQRQALPFAAQAGEGGFASSGTCLNKGQDGNIYVGTGNGISPRVLIKNGQDWQSLDVPLPGGEAAGVFSLQQAEQWLYVFGGSLKEQGKAAKALRYNLVSKQWSSLPELPLKSAVYGSALIKKDNKIHVLIANPQGVSVWQEGADNWKSLSNNNIWSLACDDQLGCIGVGKDGLVESFTFH
ncbi:hypothetical protein [Paraglaciecola sp. 25GB23A]|uniref:hypothetical protein n=1 Tax=Paraglaciecola sp. 25GB23A TaxID=3156068 RepID=UPI0032AF024A